MDTRCDNIHCCGKGASGSGICLLRGERGAATSFSLLPWHSKAFKQRCKCCTPHKIHALTLTNHAGLIGRSWMSSREVQGGGGRNGGEGGNRAIL